MRPLLVCGTRTFAEEVADLVTDMPGWEVAGFVENENRDRCTEKLHGLPIHWVDDLADMTDTHHAVCALATTGRDRFTDQVERLGMQFARLVHPTAHVSGTSELGAGTIVSAGAVVGAHTRIGRHTILNRGVLLGHHTFVGEHCTLNPGANVAGKAVLHDRVFVGMGAKVLDVEIRSEAVVGAGSVVTKDVAERAVVMGVPARVAGDKSGPR